VSVMDVDAVDEMRDGISGGSDAVSLCCVYADRSSFGIETKQIREVLGERELHKVPLAPAFIGGVVSYRGEVLTTVDLRALLGMGERVEKSCVVVLEDEMREERFGLLVDAVGGVATVSASMMEANPSTLEARGRWLFGGSYNMGTGLVVQLNPQGLRPSRLAETGLFCHRINGEWNASADCR
jgi:purine-binding chemotaxis protein CheW